MLIIPAIDLKDGKAVRLLRGKMETAKVYSDSPAEVARRWQDAGARMIHLVDLDGAVAGEPRNLGAISRILEAVHVPVELGGGIRTEKTVECYLKLGVDRVIMGTAAARDPELFRKICSRFSGRVAVGIDAKDGMVAVQGWQEVTKKKASQLARELEDAGATHIIHTDISRDGAMAGPNIPATVKLAKAVKIPVVLSGGMSRMQDVLAVGAAEKDGIRGVILGKSLYEGTIDLAAAVRAVQNEGDRL